MNKISQFISLCILLQMRLPSSESTVLEALPLGYEDIILCLPESESVCLRPYPHTQGWSGPRTAFLECCEPLTGHVSRPRGWGWRLDASYLDDLISQGWSVPNQCTAEEITKCGIKTKLKVKNGLGKVDELVLASSMENLVDSLLRLTASRL
jgi:hypothetical protein